MQFGTALSREWGITIHPADDNAVLLWYKSYFVGSIKDNVIQSQIKNTFIDQELKDFNREFMYGKGTINSPVS